MFPTEPVPERIGAYKVIRRLSAAGSADVYLGRMEGPMGFSRACALKLVPDPSEGDARVAEELAREASICAELNHPAIVRMFDFFEHDRRLVLVLEHIDGADLDRLTTYLARRRQRLGDEAIWYVGLRLVSALAHAHAATDENGEATPVIHRNIHPENVIVAWDGQVRVSGFGLGKILGRTPDTVVGKIKGTPGYMAPEQARGEPVRPRVDVYAIGALLWSLLTTKKPPVDGSRLPNLSRLRQDIPREIAAAIDAALEPVPDKRKISCAELEQWIGKIAKAEAGREELREKILLLRSARTPGSDATVPDATRAARSQPRRRVSLRGVRASQRPPGPGPLSVPPPPSSRPPLPVSERPRPRSAAPVGTDSTAPAAPTSEARRNAFSPRGLSGGRSPPDNEADRRAWRQSVPDIAAIDALLDQQGLPGAPEDRGTPTLPAPAPRQPTRAGPPPLRPARASAAGPPAPVGQIAPPGEAMPPAVGPPLASAGPSFAGSMAPPLTRPSAPGVRDDVVLVSQPDDAITVVQPPPTALELSHPLPPAFAGDSGSALPPLTASTRARRGSRARPLSALESVGVAMATAAVVVVAGLLIADSYPRGTPTSQTKSASTSQAGEHPAPTLSATGSGVAHAPATVSAKHAAADATAAPAIPDPSPPISPVSPTASTTAPPPDPALDLPGGIGLLTVTTSVNASVYLNGILVGPANEPLKVRCGRWFTRLGTPVQGSKFPAWVAPGRSVAVPCQGSVTTEMLPAPSKDG